MKAVVESDVAALNAAVSRFSPGMIEFAQRLIQTPSLPGEERAIAELTVGEMKRLSYLEDVGDATGVYDEVWTAVKSR